MSVSTRYGLSPLSNLPLIHEVKTEEKHRPVWLNTDPPTYRLTATNGEFYSFYTGEPGGAWATNLNSSPDISRAQARPVKPEAPYQIGELDLKQAELDKLKAYALSIAFQSRLRAERLGGGKFPLFVTANEQKALNDLEIETPHNLQPMAVEDLWREARRLTLSEKANETLRNLTDIEPFPGFGHRLALKFDLPDGDAPEPEPKTQDPSAISSLVGLAFAAVRGERTLVFRFLADEGLISLSAPFNYIGWKPPETHYNAGQVVRITPKGYSLVEKLKKGDLELTRAAFFICRYIPELDALYASVYKPAGELDEVRCPIRRVMDIPHVDRIDDRIVQEIQESTFVIVDLTETRTDGFNVAFEAGYALALKKPIVWTMKAPLPEKLPFDIQSHNILDYDPSKPDEFRERLKYRMLAAIEKARSN